MKQAGFILAAVIGMGAATTAAAEGFALGARVNTLGLGVEGILNLSERVNLRAGVNNYTYDFDDTYDGIPYEAELELKSASLILDWHPFAGAFRLSAGLLSNGNAINLSSSPTGTVDIGGTVFSASDVGQLGGDVEFKKTAPSVGIGWGNAVAGGKGFGVNFEIGAVFQGSPEVSLSSRGGTLSNDPALLDALAQEEQDIEDDLESFKVYPVVGLGLSYQF